MRQRSSRRQQRSWRLQHLRMRQQRRQNRRQQWRWQRRCWLRHLRLRHCRCGRTSELQGDDAKIPHVNQVSSRKTQVLDEAHSTCDPLSRQTYLTRWRKQMQRLLTRQLQQWRRRQPLKRRHLLRQQMRQRRRQLQHLYMQKVADQCNLRLQHLCRDAAQLKSSFAL